MKNLSSNLTTFMKPYLFPNFSTAKGLVLLSVYVAFFNLLDFFFLNMKNSWALGLAQLISSLFWK